MCQQRRGRKRARVALGLVEDEGRVAIGSHSHSQYGLYGAAAAGL